MLGGGCTTTKQRVSFKFDALAIQPVFGEFSKKHRCSIYWAMLFRRLHIFAVAPICLRTNMETLHVVDRPDFSAFIMGQLKKEKRGKVIYTDIQVLSQYHREF